MGKPKLSDLSEDEQLAVKRQVTRELNEAAQNARDAARQLKAAYELTAGSIEKTIQAMVDKEAADLQAWIIKSRRDLNERIAEDEQKTRDHYAKLLGATSYENLINFLVDQVYDTVLPELNRMLKTLPAPLNNIQIDKRSKSDPAVTVLTQADWEARRAAGTLPYADFTIDGR
jgi:hypothetical protein